jgi:hypothetical protein
VGEAFKQTIVPEDSVAPAVPTGLRGFLAKFTVLRGAQRNLWLTFLIKFLIYTAYSVTNKTMVLWLSKDLGFSDQAALSLVGLGLGTGDDCIHIARRLGDGCNRIAPHFFPGRRHLHDRAQRNGRYHNPIAGARMRRSSTSSR